MRPRQLRAVKIGQTALDAIMALESRADQDALAGAIVRYSMSGEEPPATVANAIVWRMIVSEINRIRQAEQAISEARAAAGRRGGYAKAAAAAAAAQEEQPETEADHVANVANVAFATSVANVANVANVAKLSNVAKLAIREEKNRVDKSRIDEREINAHPRARGTDKEDDPLYDPEAPMTLAEAKAFGETIGLVPSEVEVWYNRYGADHWRFKPDSSDKMTRRDAVYCLSNWRSRRDEFRAKAAKTQAGASQVASYLPPAEIERNEDF